MNQMISHETLEAALDWQGLIEQLRLWYHGKEVQAPERQVLTLKRDDGWEASLLIMPAWVPGESIGVKVVTFFPENAAKNRPTINAGYLLFDGATGQMQAAMDGDALTARRTAAASALAADMLARKGAEHLLVVGTGQLSQAVAQAHSAMRPYTQISIWGRSAEKAEAVAAALAAQGLPAKPVTDLESTCRSADVISTVTASTKPVIHGDWLREGSHLDLIGAFKGDMRESDDRAVTQAEVFVDQRAGASLAGDLAAPLVSGVITPAHIRADLAELCQGTHPGRSSDTARTLFKSAGMALQDLAAANMARAQTISG
ncbi:ornithine cyclodeaminase family protein [Alphaproteobacteria bacterium KMM 3653]|uniref:Ornithine cyclodeaminase family protein n=1 Tax=Harenicola maris TaxID=2841044 RepID=A0AAP2CQL1_9RHOB|nr:ornithine cyclodeaminase family protein [Harenicola maris]